MQLNKDAPKEMDLTFPIVSEGTYIWEIDEGIKLFTNEESGKTSQQIPMLVDQAIEGNEEEAGKKATLFIPIETKWGQDQLCVLLSITGLMPSFIEKFGEDIDVMDTKFQAMLALKLQGKYIKAIHEIQKDNKGIDRMRFIKIAEVKSKAKTKGKPEKKEDDEAPAW